MTPSKPLNDWNVNFHSLVVSFGKYIFFPSTLWLLRFAKWLMWLGLSQSEWGCPWDWGNRLPKPKWGCGCQRVTEQPTGLCDWSSVGDLRLDFTCGKKWSFLYLFCPLQFSCCSHWVVGCVKLFWLLVSSPKAQQNTPYSEWCTRTTHNRVLGFLSAWELLTINSVYYTVIVVYAHEIIYCCGNFTLSYSSDKSCDFVHVLQTWRLRD